MTRQHACGIPLGRLRRRDPTSQAGRLAEAEALYRGELERFPKHPGALHLLGVVSHQQGHDDWAAELIALAMVQKPHQATYHSNYGLALRGLERLDEAADALHQAFRLGNAERRPNVQG